MTQVWSDHLCTMEEGRVGVGSVKMIEDTTGKINYYSRRCATEFVLRTFDSN